jgi:hypothetical protein
VKGVLRIRHHLPNGPRWMAVWRHHDIGNVDRIVTGFDPPCPQATIADRPDAPEADEVDFSIPLPVS